MITPEEVEALYPIDKVQVYENGLVVQRKAKYPTKHTYSPRKGIYEMSKKSRLLLTHIVTNSPIKMCSMLNLTWGDFLPPVNGKELKRQLNIFLKEFRRKYKTPEYIWFLEFTKQGRPHIHILTSLRPTEQDLVWFGAMWSKISVKDAWMRLSEDKVKDYKIVKELDISVILDEWEKSKKVHSHKKAWELFYKENGATRYCLKYATKAEQKLVPPDYPNVGRFWGASDGVHPKPIAEMVIGETMDDPGFKKIFGGTRIEHLPLIPRYVFQRDALKYFSERGLKLTEIFGSDPHKFVDKVDGDVVTSKVLTNSLSIVAPRSDDTT